MKKYFLGFLIIIFAAIGIINLVNAADVQYPVAELGNCQDEAACKLYCDNPANTEACVNFAEKNNLMSEEEIQTAKKFLAAGSIGPGGCTDKDSCEEYCNDINHIDACILFAEENDLMSPKELEEAKKIQAAIANGVKPPPCGNKKACDAYCGASEHMEECITFGAEAGFIQGKDLEDAQKMLQAIKRGVKPPPCNGKEACDEYCSTPENMEVCINFAMEAGFMSEEEKADSQKMLQALKQGIKPPSCKGKEGCDTYCQQEEHFEECMNFAVAAGFMSEEDAKMARKTGGKGPGGCKGKEECEAFCTNPDNQETCFNFAKDNGMMSEEDLKQMEEGKQQMQQALQQAPQEVIDCLQSALGVDLIEKMKNGTGMPSKEIGDKMQECFQQVGAGPQTGPSSDTMMQGGGPGGCQTPEECGVYCQQNPTECQNFAPPQWPEGQPKGDEIMPPKQTGPGGCASPEECEAYCSTHRVECGAPSGSDNPQPQQPFQPGIQCEGENCGDQQYQPQPEQIPIQPDQYFPPPSEEFGPPPSGDFVPSAPPSEPVPPVEPQPPTSSLDANNLLGATANIFQKFLLGK